MKSTNFSRKQMRRKNMHKKLLRPHWECNSFEMESNQMLICTGYICIVQHHCVVWWLCCVCYVVCVIHCSLFNHLYHGKHIRHTSESFYYRKSFRNKSIARPVCKQCVKIIYTESKTEFQNKIKNKQKSNIFFQKKKKTEKTHSITVHFIFYFFSITSKNIRTKAKKNQYIFLLSHIHKMLR